MSLKLCCKFHSSPALICKVIAYEIANSRCRRMLSPDTYARTTLVSVPAKTLKMVRTAVEYDHLYNFLQLHRYPAECSQNT